VVVLADDDRPAALLVPDFLTVVLADARPSASELISQLTVTSLYCLSSTSITRNTLLYLVSFASENASVSHQTANCFCKK
jgi:hypothetical protein